MKREVIHIKKLNGSPLYTESKVNEMKQSGNRYRRLFASDLLKVDKTTMNVYYDNDRAVQLNSIK